jgi:transposase
VRQVDLPMRLPRERVVIPAPTACPCCGGKLAKLAEDITETLEVVPRQWKVMQTVRGKFSPAFAGTGSAGAARRSPSRPPCPRPRRRQPAGNDPLRQYGHHQRLIRQSESFAREHRYLDVSTMADWVGVCTTGITSVSCADLLRKGGHNGPEQPDRTQPYPRLRKAACPLSR